MALPLENTFQGGTNAVAISNANSGGASGTAIDSIVGTAPNFSSTNTIHSLMSMNPVTTAQSMVQWVAAMGTTTELWARWYVFMGTNPSVNLPICYVRDTTNAANVCGLRLTSARVAGITADGSTTVQAFTNVQALTTWARYEIHCLISGGNATTDGRLYLTPDSMQPTEVQTITTATAATSFGAIRFGANLTSTGTLWMAGLCVNGVTWPGSATARPRLVRSFAPQMMMGARR